MFDYISGLLSYLSGNGIVIEQSGIGYKIVCANPFSYQPLMNQDTKVYIYQYVREDAMILYGFKTREERELFVRLLTVSGIGPKNALAVLASGDPDEIIQAIEAEDNRYLTRFPGIGKKTAGQIILDLKGKLADFSVSNNVNTDAHAENTALSEALDALEMLGYSEREIHRVIPELKKQELTAENYVKEALRLLTNT
ncbi:Holliday junction branch migration protein RuvA [Sporolactobacillus pectinivorans]|uniref:Holliday junction branch migration protein RuvA n=1 Tax=Sporolactobacillus pectinivorans TaxID=1591408 RepID=UPI000C259746|nr:Holliday junction branch migration protein RuvA [Sporolactobacillus pectinivorans]